MFMCVCARARARVYVCLSLGRPYTVDNRKMISKSWRMGESEVKGQERRTGHGTQVQ